MNKSEGDGSLRQDTKIWARLPSTEVRRWIVAQAAKEFRSLSEMTSVLLMEAITARGAAFNQNVDLQTHVRPQE